MVCLEHQTPAGSGTLSRDWVVFLCFSAEDSDQVSDARMGVAYRSFVFRNQSVGACCLAAMMIT